MSSRCTTQRDVRSNWLETLSDADSMSKKHEFQIPIQCLKVSSCVRRRRHLCTLTLHGYFTLDVCTCKSVESNRIEARPDQTRRDSTRPAPIAAICSRKHNGHLADTSGLTEAHLELERHALSLSLRIQNELCTVPREPHHSPFTYAGFRHVIGSRVTLQSRLE